MNYMIPKLHNFEGSPLKTNWKFWSYDWLQHLSKPVVIDSQEIYITVNMCWAEVHYGERTTWIIH